MRTLTRPDGAVLRWESIGPDGAPVTLLAHGTGSSPEFVLRALGPSVVAAGGQAVAWWLRGHGPHPWDGLDVRLASQLGDMAALAQHLGARSVGGVSLGAHLAAFLAGTQPTSVDRLLAVMPAWSGPADDVAGLNAGQADGIETNGVAGELERILKDHPGWVADELALAWPHHEPASFCRVLRAVAHATAPDASVLHRVTARTTVVVLADDPMHPADVGRSWAHAVPGARLVEVSSDEVAADRTALAGPPADQPFGTTVTLVP